MDFLKLIYQNSYGPRHLHRNPNRTIIHRYMVSEIETMEKESNLDVEDIGNGYVRMHLHRNSEGFLNRIEELFHLSMNEPISEENAMKHFHHEVERLIELLKKQIIALPYEESMKMIEEYYLKGPHPVHHSKTYQNLYHPHYRVVAKKFI
ncbi:MAG: hypothetical protein JXB08_03705 [Bacilli bacterium]|nr:hypothetical protein [Bacilli bacterium]